MGRTIRNYDIIRPLGEGRFGEVLLAVGEVPGRGALPARRRVVAIKKLRDTTHPEAARLLLQEFALLDQVKHRSIVRVLEYLPNEHAVVMEAIQGANLREVLDSCAKAHEQVFTEAAVEIACEIADALYQAYTTPGDNGEALHLVHRDLKPENVMLTPQGEVKILDFGLARVDNTDFAREDPGRIRGTPVYMAPEQARGEVPDHRTDLFALGLITYELLLNRPAYRVPERSLDPVAEVLDAVERADLQDRIAELESKIPAMGRIIARCLQARPQNRYQDGHELLVDLRRQLYRDRGAYLKEFCDFFFGSLHPLEPFPAADEVEAGSGRGRRLSIQERLQRSMDRERTAPPPARPPPPPAPAPQGGPPAAPFQSRAKPVVLPPAGSPPPPRPPPTPAGRRVKEVGRRAPDETGMLKILPVNQMGTAEGSGGEQSATSFFAIPAPKAERRTEPAPPPAAPIPPPGSPSPVAPPPGRVQGPTAPGVPQALVQGPVAPGSPSGGSPFQVAAGPMAPPPEAESHRRVNSYRVYAIILAVIVLTCAAVVAAIWFRPSKEDSAPAAQSERVPTEVAAVAPSRKARQQDTAEPSLPAAPPPRAATRKAASSTRTASSASAPSAPKAAAAPRGPASLSVVLTDNSPATAVEVVCPSGFRQRVGLSGGRASVPGVPIESCTLYFKGPATAQFSPVRGGQSVSCRIQGSTAVCQ
ncbi:MAG: serine/threonine protein kinase [Deltaproteobacteria bacterium]|nr:serine/threonine protein kinase [Deltaproteobacteria bacterium]